MLRIVLVFVLLVWGLGSLKASSPVGKWKGSWSSGSTGHRGALRARIRATENGAFKAVFAGRFAVVVPFFYRTELFPVASRPGQYVSVKKLPLLGTYRMRATVSGNDFHATFSGGQDRGIFEMKRR